MYRYLHHVRSFICATKLAIPKIRNCFAASSLFAVSCAKLDIPTKFNDKEFENEIKRATKQGELYLVQLMRMLRTVILQTSIEYQECLIQQIKITRKNTQIGPIGEHWDELTGFRVKGNELKEDLNRYEALAVNIADIITGEGIIIFFGNNISLDTLNKELNKLQRLCREQLQEINRYETELLEVGRDSILNEKASN